MQHSTSTASRVGNFALVAEGPMARVFEAQVEGTDLTVVIRHELVLKCWTWEVTGYAGMLFSGRREATHGAAVTAAVEAADQVIGR